MHLLVAQRGVIQDGGEAVDLGLSPADIVVLSAADSDLASLAAAHARLGEPAPSLRLANLMQLAHPMSVDLLVAKTLRKPKLVVVRLLGGKSYWCYGLESLRAAASATGLKLAALPGDAEPIRNSRRCRIWIARRCCALHEYLQEGGPENAVNSCAIARTCSGVAKRRRSRRRC